MTRLPYVSAAYNEDAAIRVCLHDTRKALLDLVYELLLAPVSEETRAVWLRALAGTGKSTMLKTVATRLKQQGMLGGSFIFSRNIVDRSNMNVFYATLASHLAIEYEAYRVELVRVLDNDPRLKNVEPEEQLVKLLIEPLRAIKTTKPFVFVIDALDECGSDYGDTFLRLLLDHIDDFPSSIRFFFTSRPERPIVNHLSVYSKPESRTKLRVIDVDDGSHDATSLEDMYSVLVNELKGVQGVNEDEIRKLAELANGLFQFGMAAALLIKKPLYPTAIETLNAIIDLSDNSDRLTLLEDLYATLFKQLYKQPTRKSGRKAYDQRVDEYQLVIGAIVHSRVPLSMKTIGCLVNLPVENVESVLTNLSSVLLLPGPEDHDTPVRVRHLTFTEFVTDGSEESVLKQLNEKLVVSNRIHSKIVESAFQIMGTQLRFNISNFPLSFVPNSPQTRKQAEACIPREVAYACEFWGEHLAEVDEDVGLDLSGVKMFMEKKLLAWLEVLSVIEAVNVGRRSLVGLERELEKTKNKVSMR